MPDADPQHIAEWRAEFEQSGIHEVQAHIDRGEYVTAQRFAAFRWLKEIQQQRERREVATHWYVKWTFWAAVAAVAVGVIGVLVTLTH